MFQTLTAQRKATRASVAMMAVCLLLLQVVIAGLGIGSSAPGEESGAFFGVTCASKQAAGIDGGPISPTSPATIMAFAVFCTMERWRSPAPGML